MSPPTRPTSRSGSKPSSTRRPPTRCSRPSRPPTSGPVSPATGARGPSGKLAEVFAHALDGLFDPVVGRGQADAEEALATGAVHRAGRDDDRRLFEDGLGEGSRGVAARDRGPDVDRALRRGDVDADRAEGRDDEVAAPATWIASKSPESTLVLRRQ